MKNIGNQKVTPKRKSLWRRIFTPRLVFLLGLIVLATTVVFSYYYVLFTEMIDAKLQGDIFVRTTGIYTAPVTLKQGQKFKRTDLIGYFQRIGYLGDDKQRDRNRGHYSVKGNTLEIEPSNTGIIDGSPIFSKINIKYSDDGQKISSIYDVTQKKIVPTSLIEPELLTSINQEREKRKIVDYKDLPKNLVDAIISIEDRRFFDHPGIDFRGLFRAIWRNVEEGNVHQGGSTVTQQLVKNFFLTSERTLKRKLSEAFISVLLETRLSKEQIFQMYCNEIYMGQDGSYSINGMGEAAKFYFNKDISTITLAESAFLAGIIRGPGYYSPFSQKARAKDRRDQVLEAMVVAGKLSQEEADAAKKVELGVRPKSASSNAEAPYFLDYLQLQVNDILGSKKLSQDSFRIYSTIDMELQRAADKAVRDGLAQIEKDYGKRYKPGSLQAALIAINAKNGEIVAMVGGRDYSASQLNRATEARRQPGSVFKPIVYTAALNTAFEEERDKIITPATKFLDAKETFVYGDNQTYEPDNFGMAYSNEMVDLRQGLTKSLNVVTVRVAEQTGYWRVAKMAEEMGLPKPQPFPSIALGVSEATPLEIASAYTAFPNLGVRYDTISVSRITDSNGKTIFQNSPKSKQVIRAEVSYIITNILQDVINRGTAARARSLG
ncbi:MAG: transglycosylase domain-containing protein, partial [Blastocatellia bacterium]|nr:transglycosylase domain-containing protein [Blastocatellia bacterium]